MESACERGSQTLIFDLDGTLIDSTAGIGSALSAAFRSVGRVMPDTALRQVIGPPIGVIAKRLEPSLTEEDLGGIERTYRLLYDESAWRMTELFAGVIDTLKALRQAGHRLFLVTNKPLVPTIKILAHLGLEDLFHDVITRDTTSPPYQTKAAMLADLIGRHHLKPGSSVMVGDTAEDGEAAEANGIPFLFMTYGYGTAKTADHVFDHFSDLFAWAARR